MLLDNIKIIFFVFSIKCECGIILQNLDTDTVESFQLNFPELLINFLALLSSVTLKNAAELLEFAAMYNADQLKLSCLQFIVFNMAALLESK